ncbi:MAG: GDSL-type esterase/lipase family protein [Lactobacillales bacterium]|jgi:lysophospholipase L1-like esterase|nr:GDSL-type esterase/lipase family protein [Lactobacillales bacterium]
MKKKIKIILALTLIFTTLTGFKAGAKVDYVAIGDSLTAGDGNKENDRFASAFTELMNEKYDIKIKQHNYGVSGNTSEQILQRLTDNTNGINDDIKNAQIISITVGGNDIKNCVMEKIVTNLNLDQAEFYPAIETYEKTVTKIIKAIRKQNKKAQIYVMGIYNPFYNTFPRDRDLFDLVINRYNDAIKRVIEKDKKVTYVQTSDLIKYPKIDFDSASDLSDEPQDSGDPLSTYDYFHPNAKSHKLWAKALAKAVTQDNNFPARKKK